MISGAEELPQERGGAEELERLPTWESARIDEEDGAEVDAKFKLLGRPLLLEELVTKDDSVVAVFVAVRFGKAGVGENNPDAESA